MKPDFKDYAAQVVQNSQALAEAFIKRGYKVVSGGSENHLFLVDLRQNLPDLTAKKAQETLDLAHITCNKNTVPFESRSPFQASGIRLGTPAVTTRGFTADEMDEIADCIDVVLHAIGSDELERVMADVRTRVATLTSRHPLPY